MPFLAELESEFWTLTKIGNDFTIRHHEHDKHDLPNDHARDYLFMRLVGLIAFVLRQAGRMGRKESTSLADVGAADARRQIRVLASFPRAGNEAHHLALAGRPGPGHLGEDRSGMVMPYPCAKDLCWAPRDSGERERRLFTVLRCAEYEITSYTHHLSCDGSLLLLQDATP